MLSYAYVLVALLILDGLWLLFVAKSFYTRHLGYILAEKVTYWPVGVFYLMYAFGIVYFAVWPALQAQSLMVALTRGTLLGLMAYGAYDFTNQATLAKWPIAVTFVDLLWGICITATASAVAYLLVR